MAVGSRGFGVGQNRGEIKECGTGKERSADEAGETNKRKNPNVSKEEERSGEERRGEKRREEKREKQNPNQESRHRIQYKYKYKCALHFSS